MIVKALTISDKGQIVIPKQFVKYLGSKVIKLEIGNDQEVRIIPIKDVAGSLSDFAKKQIAPDFSEIRNQAWNQSITEKFNKE